jgi:hypothetical protein
MGKINVKQFRSDLSKAVGSLKNLAYGTAKSKLEFYKDQLLDKFDNHEVTVELEGGATGENITGTMGGRDGANLFTFLGFAANDNPIDDLRNALHFSIQMDNDPSVRQDGRYVIFSFPVSIPTVEDLEPYALLPGFNRGANWIEELESGVTGWAHYLYWRQFSPEVSRSEEAVQVKNKLRSGKFPRIPYLTPLLKDFQRSLR